MAIESEDLEKRVLRVVPNDNQAIAEHVVNGVAKLPTKNKIYDNKRGSTASTSLWRPFYLSKSRWAPSFQVGPQSFTDCIAAVIVSRRGIYVAHFYEDSGAMDPNNKGYAAKLLEGGSKNTFDSVLANLEVPYSHLTKTTPLPVE